MEYRLEGEILLAAADDGAHEEFSTLAIGRYRLRVCDVANLLSKHRNSVTKWLNTGLRLERDDSEFKERIDFLGAAISRQF